MHTGYSFNIIKLYTSVYTTIMAFGGESAHILSGYAALLSPDNIAGR